MENRVKKIEDLKKHFADMFIDSYVEVVLSENFLIHLEFLITCMDYNLKINDEELRSIQIFIANHILKNISTDQAKNC